jgi:hypothetical protein
MWKHKSETWTDGVQLLLRHGIALTERPIEFFQYSNCTFGIHIDVCPRSLDIWQNQMIAIPGILSQIAIRVYACLTSPDEFSSM